MFLLTLISYQIWLYFWSIIPYIFVGFNIRVECESLVKICDECEFVIGSRVDTPQKVM